MGVSLIGQQQVRALAGPSAGRPADGDGVQDREQVGVVPGLATAKQHRQRPAAAVDGQVDLGAQPAPGAAQRLSGRYRNPGRRGLPGCRPGRWRPFFTGASGMLVRPHHRGIHGHHPVNRLPVVADLGAGQDLVPGPIRSPPAQPLVARFPRPVALRQVPPRRPSAQFPQDPVDHLPVITPPAPRTISWRQRRLDRRPRLIR